MLTPGAPCVQQALAEPVRQAATSDVLGKDAWNAPKPADVVAADDVRVETQMHPGLTFALKVRLVCFRLHKLRARAFHGQIHMPPPVVDMVHESHPTTRVDPFDLIEVQEDIADVPGH